MTKSVEDYYFLGCRKSLLHALETVARNMRLNLKMILPFLIVLLQTILVTGALPHGNSKTNNVRLSQDIQLENRSISVHRLPDGHNYLAKGMDKSCRTCPQDTFFREVCPEDDDQFDSDCPVCPPGTHQPVGSHLLTSCKQRPSTTTPTPTTKPKSSTITCGECPDGYTKTGCSPMKENTTICCPAVTKPNGNFNGCIHVEADPLVTTSPSEIDTTEPEQKNDSMNDMSNTGIADLETTPRTDVNKPGLDEDRSINDKTGPRDNETGQRQFNVLYIFLGVGACALLTVILYSVCKGFLKRRSVRVFHQITDQTNQLI